MIFIKKVLIVSLFFALLLNTLHAGDPSSVSHPRLLLTQSEFDDWQARHSQFPWDQFSNTWWDGNPTWAKQLSAKLNGCTLGYVLDYNSASPSRADYVREIIEAIDFLYETEFSYSTEHGQYTGDAACTVEAILAFDLIYDAPELSAADRNRAYTRLGEIVTWYRNNYTQRGWRLCPYGLFSVWALFEGDPIEIATEVDRYKAYLQETLQFPDGSWIASPRYFTARIGGRFAKTAPIDIITKVGAHNFYNDPQMHGFMDWACSFWRTPFGAEQLFGDGTNYSQEISTVATRFGNYSQKHGRMAKWYINNFTSTGFVPTGYGSPFAFIYGTTNPDFPELEPLMPTSLLMDNYGATLWGRNDSTEALMGTVHSFNGRTAGHDHDDTCSIHIAGYGAHLLFNSGGSYYYTPTRHLVEAQYQNVVLIGSRTTHDLRYGAGLTDGLVGGQVEYGRTDSGNALGNGKHYRSLYHVHATAGINGYFLLLDEVQPNNTNDNIKVNLHPNSTAISTVSSKQEYHCPANFVVEGDTDGTEAITLFYGTTPNQVNIPTGQRDYGGVQNIDYLEAVYTAGADGWLRAVTLLYPQDGTHGMPQNIARLSGTGFTGVGIKQSNIWDHMLESDNVNTYTRYGISFRGKGIFYRVDGSNVPNYAVTHGRSFDDGQTSRRGFSSTVDVSIQMDEMDGSVDMLSNGSFTIYYPGIQGLLVNGFWVPQTLNSGSVTLSLSAGNYTLEVTTDSFFLGNDATASTNIDGWKSNMLINETDTYTNTSGTTEQISIDDFEFYAGAAGDPVTPFVVKVLADNSFTVLAVGDTRTSYSVGAINTVAFASTAPVINLANGETIAVGFLDANANGTGGGTSAVIPFDTASPADEIWYTGGGSGSDSGSVTVGSAPTTGTSILTNLSRNYHFNIGFSKNTWVNQDIGTVSATGSMSEVNGVFTINGSGADIWGTADEFHFACKTLSGDGVLTAKVESLTNTNSWAKAGVMIRESLEAGSKHSFMAVTPGNGTSFQRRTANNGTSYHTTPGNSQAAPHWVRLERTGSTFTGYSSADGMNWDLIGSAAVSMNANVYAGLAVTSHNDGVVTTAELSNVTVTN